MIRCIAIDDEPLALDIIADYVAKIPELSLVASTTNAIEALPLIQNGEVDLVFLDVQMPELTGIQLLKIINGRCDVILTTAYPQYALDGYELNVLDYLLKPIAFDRFYRSVQKALHNSRIVKAPETQVPPVQHSDAVDFIFVKTEHKIQRVDLDDILYIEGLKDYISIYTADERIVTLQNMKKMEDILPTNRFIRVHRSYIVALDKIGSIERGRIFMGDKIIPVGDTYRDAFFRHIGDRHS
ncbi:LytR/AlgR family response regulator transcription factor [Parapedobacter lycopersici]|uniref:LytR/AlgR family response regulator transcription factor n=1 Tax=Parapedobacter lycopersici TaxID=1864939 RepID=UPI00214D2C55|nr:LytTR family DNA-binding domain-containing protein [Parapedobacter lycopersici]